MGINRQYFPEQGIHKDALCCLSLNPRQARQVGLCLGVRHSSQGGEAHNPKVLLDLPEDCSNSWRFLVAEASIFYEPLQAYQWHLQQDVPMGSGFFETVVYSLKAPVGRHLR